MLETSFSKLLHNLVYQYAFNISSLFTPQNQGFQFGAKFFMAFSVQKVVKK